MARIIILVLCGSINHKIFRNISNIYTCTQYSLYLAWCQVPESILMKKIQRAGGKNNVETYNWWMRRERRVNQGKHLKTRGGSDCQRPARTQWHIGEIFSDEKNDIFLYFLVIKYWRKLELLLLKLICVHINKKKENWNGVVFCLLREWYGGPQWWVYAGGKRNVGDLTPGSWMRIAVSANTAGD